MAHFLQVDQSKRDSSPTPEAGAAGGGLLNALMSVMNSRNQAINPSGKNLPLPHRCPNSPYRTSLQST